MIKSATVHTSNRNSSEAGMSIGQSVLKALDGQAPDALVVFASARHDYSALLGAIDDTCHPKAMVGSSSAGEFTMHSYDEGSVSAVALLSSEMQFVPALARGLREDRVKAAKQMVSAFRGLEQTQFPCRSALVLTDALAGFADDFVEQLTVETAAAYRLFGGGAGDDANFTRTHVFYGKEAVPDAAVALEILSKKPIGIGVHHAWEPATAPYRVTEAEGMRLVSLNNAPAAEAIQEFAKASGQHFDQKDPIPFFLHNVLGLKTPSGYKLRVPLGVHEDGSLQCAADVPVNGTVCIMKPTGGSALAATEAALKEINGQEPEVALFFDCVATRLRMGKDFAFELEAVRKALQHGKYAGCNTYGQIARADNQFSGFHNCTAVVAVIPK